MSQVQKLIEAQNISVSSTDESSSDAGVVVEEVDSETNSFSENSSTKYADDEVEDASNVRDVTMKQLGEIINQSSQSESSALTVGEAVGPLQSQPLPASVPRINYMSMAVDETFVEESSNFNEIAAKYLPSSDFVQGEMTEKTFKIQRVFSHGAVPPSSRSVNMTSINFSCNMSIATKTYLQRYELMDSGGLAKKQIQQHQLPQQPNQILKLKQQSSEIQHSQKQTIKKFAQCTPKQPLGDVNGRVLGRRGKHPSNLSRTSSESDKENILDFKKLRSLPKLL